MAGRRIFIAIDISDAARAACAAHIDQLRRQFPKVRVGWERPEKLHITLKFLGPTDEPTLAKLNEHLKSFASNLSPGRLQLSHAGVFPNNHKPRIFWIGVDDLNSFAGNAVAGVERAAVEVGFDADDRRFTPHITIGRVRDPAAARDVADSHLSAQVEPVEFEVDSLVVYESKLLPTGSVYSVVSRFAA